MPLHLQAGGRKQLLQQPEPNVARDRTCCRKDAGCLVQMIPWTSQTWEGV